MEKKLTVLQAVLLAVLACCSACNAGFIRGEVRDSRGFPQRLIYTSAIAHGTRMYFYRNAITDDNGLFQLSFPAAVYSLGTSEKDTFELLYRREIVMPEVGDAPYQSLRFSPAAFCFGTEPYSPGYEEYAASFRATGENVVSIGLRCASPTSGHIEVTVLDGEGPDTAALGPTRKLACSNSDGKSAYWSAGEVPTVPGRIYTARFRLSGGGMFSLYRQTVRDRMRMENPDGKTWVDGALSDEPLEMTVNQDDAGLVNTMCCVSAPFKLSVQNYAGQTFVARGTSVLAITWQGLKTNPYIFTLHRGANGQQVGEVMKHSHGASSGYRSVVTFNSGEFPTIPGQDYYIKIRQSDNSAFYLYITKPDDVYAEGTGYLNGTPMIYDVGFGIYEEKFPGAADQAAVSVSDFRVESTTSSSALVKWTTGVDADSTVEYGKVTPYEHTVYNSTPVAEHSAAISGLEPNTMYHVRATSRASGYRQVVTKDLVFVTASDTLNLLSDGSFESGAFGEWTNWGDGDISVSGPSDGGSGPHTGSYGLVGRASAATVQGGAYQRVAAVPGLQYRLSGWLYTHCEGGDFSSKASQTIARIGIDPMGGTDPSGVDVVWTPYTYSQDAWTPVGMSATAGSDHVTVFVCGGNEQSLDSSAFAFDDMVLAAATGAAPADVGLTEALTGCDDGSYLRIARAICTATPAQVGACYIETSDRVSGLRVETADPVGLGEQVTVTGTIRTKPSGERYLEGATIDARMGAKEIRPVLATNVRYLGGSAAGECCAGIPDTLGPYNVGTLMRVCGTVKSHGSGCVYLSDGSLPGDGLKIDTSGLSTGMIPAVGQAGAVTGIVGLEGTAPAAGVVLRPRGNSDLDF